MRASGATAGSAARSSAAPSARAWRSPAPTSASTPSSSTTRLAAAGSHEADLRDLAKGPAANEVGKLLAERAKQAGVEQVVFDRGGYKYHGRVKSLADGAREGGLEF